MALIRSLSEDLNHLQQKIEAVLTKYSIQLFKMESEDEIEPWASAFLVSYQGNHYALSAGHVFDECPAQKLGPMIGSDWINIYENSNLIAFSPPENQELNQMDLTVWKLNEAVSNELKVKWDFYPLYDKDFKPIDFSGKYHFLFGFPWRHTKVRRSDYQIVTNPFYLTTTTARPEKYADIGARKELHVLINYNRFTTQEANSKNQRISPIPEGMSGCGLWVLPSPYIENVSIDNLKLAGIFTHYFEKHAVLVANRLSESHELFKAND